MDEFGWNELHNAVKLRNLSTVEELIDSGMEINKGTFPKRNTPLHISAHDGYIPIMKVLLNITGIQINKKNKDKKTCLYLAVEQNHMEIVELLLENEANFDLIDKNGRNCLHISIENGRFDIAKLLLDKGINVNIADKYGKTPLHEILEKIIRDPDEYRESLLIVKMLIQNGANLNITNNDFFTSLAIAVKNNMLDIVRMMLQAKQGYNVNYLCASSKTALYFAAEEAHVQMVELLMEFGAEYNIRVNDRILTTPTHACAFKNDTNSLNIFSAFRDCLQARNDLNDSPLMLAVRHDCVNAVKYLVMCGADILDEHVDGNTPLEVAVEMQNLDILLCMNNLEELLQAAINTKKYGVVKGLLDLGAKPNLDTLRYAVEFEMPDYETKIKIINSLLKLVPEIDRRFETLANVMYKNPTMILNEILHTGLRPTVAELCTAIENHSNDIVDGFLNHNINIEEHYGWGTPLIWAIRSTNMRAVDSLLQRGANPHSFDYRGKSCLECAIENKHNIVIDLIQNACARVENIKEQPINFKHKVDKYIEENGGPKGGWFWQRALEFSNEDVKYLISKIIEYNINETDEDGKTMLYLTVNKMADECSMMLLEAGADPNVCSKDKKLTTALHVAVFHNNKFMVQNLVHHGADVNAVNLQGDIPLFWARSYECAKILVELNSNINHYNLEGKNVLHSAMEHMDDFADNFDKYLALVLQKQLVLDQFSLDGQTPLYIALKTHEYKKAEHLIRHGADSSLGSKDPKISCLDLVKAQGRMDILNLMMASSTRPVLEDLQTICILVIRNHLKWRPGGIYNNLVDIQTNSALRLPKYFINLVMLSNIAPDDSDDDCDYVAVISSDESSDISLVESTDS